MVLKTKSIYDRKEKGDGTRVLITRYYPRGVKKDRFDSWLRPLSPSPGLVKSYKAGAKSWAEFKRLFVDELDSSEESAAALRTVADLARKGDVTLLCFERQGLPCHRHVVQEILTKPRLLSRFVPPGRGRRSGRVPKSASSEIRFYPRRKAAGKAT
jgi:uncharacterized protein YeaO (DUF488 family)